MQYYLLALKNYANFKGRTTRKEFWMFALFSMLAVIIMVFLDAMLGTVNPESGVGILTSIYSLLTLIPNISITVRRLHDTNRSGWFYLLIIIPLIGALALLIFTVLPSKDEGNRFNS
ncbi:MAG: DUF805 domain-containing protein [Vibrio sp.]